MATPANPKRPNSLAWPLTLAAFVLLTAVGIGMYREHFATPQHVVGPPPAEAPVAFGYSITNPLDAATAKPAVALHNVEYDTIDGTRVLKIQLVATGDEILVDAITGKFLGKNTASVAVPPGGGAKFAAPHEPMMM